MTKKQQIEKKLQELCEGVHTKAVADVPSGAFRFSKIAEIMQLIEDVHQEGYEKGYSEAEYYSNINQ